MFAPNLLPTNSPAAVGLGSGRTYEKAAKVFVPRHSPRFNLPLVLLVYS